MTPDDPTVSKKKRSLSHRLRASRRKMLRNPISFFKLLTRSIPKLRLTHQLLGFFVVVVLIPLLLLSFSIYSINQKAVKKQVRHFTEHTAEATYESLTLEMTWQQKQAQLATEYWLMLEDIPSASRRQAAIQSFFNAYPDFQAVGLYDEKGQRKGYFWAPGFKPVKDLSLADKLEQPVTQPSFEVAYQKSTNAAQGLSYLLKIQTPVSPVDSTSPVRTVAFLKQFPYMSHLVDEGYQTFNDGFMIVDQSGTIIAGPPRLLSQKLSSEDIYLFQSLQAGVIKEFSTREVRPDPDASEDTEEPALEKVFIKVPTLGWGVIIESPYQVQGVFIARARLQSVGLVFLCIIIIVILGILYTRGINRNFRQLIKGIKALAEGRYSRKIRLITKSWTPYEIVYLTAEVNRMANKISTAWASIQKLNQELVYKNEQDVFIAQATQRLHSSLELETVCQMATVIVTERPENQAALLMLLSDYGEFELSGWTLPEAPPDLESFRLEESPKLLLQECMTLQSAIPVSASTFPFLPSDSRVILQPIYYQSAPIGVLLVVRSSTLEESLIPFDDGLLMNLIASQIGVAIHQARQWKQLQRANTQLSKLDELKSNLIDTVSHELRTPLTNIKGYTSRLIRYEDSLDPAIKLKSLKVIKQQADRLTRLVDDLLVIPDLERQDGIRVFPDRVHLPELIQRCIGFVEEKANRPIEVQTADPNLEILVDPDRMEQVLLNLLDNAIKYSREASAIQVNARQVSPATVQIEVFNDCEPIPQDELDTLFAKFKRLDERLTRTTRGTGLGLFITKGLIEAMGGTIRLEGDAGFRVVIQVPLYEDVAPAGEANPTDTVVMS